MKNIYLNRILALCGLICATCLSSYAQMEVAKKTNILCPEQIATIGDDFQSEEMAVDTTLVESSGISYAPARAEDTYTETFVWDEIVNAEQRTTASAMMYYYDFYRCKQSGKRPCLRIVIHGDTRLIDGYAYFPVDGTYSFSGGSKKSGRDGYCTVTYTNPSKGTVAPGSNPWLMYAGSCTTDSYYCMYYDASNKKHYLNSGTVTISTAANGDVTVSVNAKGGTSTSSTSNTYNITVSGYARKLDVTTNGSGTVSQSADNCLIKNSSGTELGYAVGTNITLTPTPSSGWFFIGWTGDCAGSITDNHDGTYTYIVPNNHCSVTANFVQRVEVTDIIDTCSNELPFTWRKWNKGGKVITSMAQNGIKDTVKTGEKIDSIVTLQLRIHPAYTTYIKDERTLCAEEMKTFTWQGETFTQYVHITDTAKVDIKKGLQTSFGCDSLVNLLLTIVPIDTIHSKKTVCSSELPITWQGKTIWGRPDDDDTIHVYQHGTEGCYSVVQLDLTVHQSDTTLDHKQVCSFPYEWTPPTWTSSITIHNMEEVATEGKVTEMNQHGCDSIVQLVVHMLPTITHPDTNAVVCQAEQEYFIWPGHEHLGQLTHDGTYKDTARYVFSGCDSAYFTLNLRFVVPQTETTELAHICEGETYNWEKHPKYQGLREGGIYKDTLLSKEGCDSLYSTLNLIKHIAKDSIERDTACSNDIGYEWHGKWIEFGEEDDYLMYDTLRSSGCDSIRWTMQLHKVNTEQDFIFISGCAPSFTWTDKWGTEHTFTYPTTYETIFHQEAGGCESSLDVSITYLQPSASTADTSLCSNEFPFIWHGHTIQSADDNGKTDTLRNVAGCDSVVTLNMTLHPAYVEKLGTDIQLGTKYINTGESFTFCGRELTVEGFYKDTITCLISGCDSVVSVNLKVLNNIGHEYDTICHGDIKKWNGSEYTETGDYEYHTSTTHGTDSTAILHLKVHPTYNVTDPVVKCDNELPFTWNGETIASAADDGKQVTLPTIHGCDSVVTLALTIHPTYSVTDPVVKCDNELPFTWNGETIASAADDGKQVTLSSSVGCDSVVTLALTIHPTYSVTDPVVKCDNELPFTWNGETIASVADDGKQVTLPTIHGCDSLVTLALTIHPTYSVTDPVVKCDNELPFTWNGETIASAADDGKQVTLSSSVGCDSVVTLALTIHPTYSVTDPVVKCDNELPFTWNGETIASVADDGKQVTLPTIHGCDSLVTLALTIHPTYSVTDPVVKCDNELPFTWNGETIASAADDGKQVTLPTIHSCDSVVTLALTIHPTYDVDDPISKCESGLPFTWNGETIASAADDGKQVTLPTIHGCDSLVTLRLSIVSTLYATDPVVKCDNELPFTWNGETIASAADDGKKVTISSSAGCDSVVTLALTIHPTYSVTDPVVKCDNELPFTWNGETIASAADDGKQVTLPTIHGCDSVVTLALTIHPTYSVTDPVVKCDNELPFTWNGETIASAADDGKQVTLPTIHGCDSVVTLALTIHPTYDVEDPISKCESGLPFTWNGVTIASAADDGKQVTLPTIHGCDSLVTLRLSIVSTLYATDPVVKCDNELPFTWNGETIASAADDGKQVTLSSSVGCDSVVTLALTIHKSYTLTDGATICDTELPYKWEGETFTAGGSKTKNLYTTLGCDSIVTFTLTVNASTKSEASKTIQQYELPYTWDGIVFKNAADTTIVLPGGNAKGCDSTVIRHLTVNTCYDLRASMTLDVVCANQKEMYATLLVSQGEVASYSLHYKTQDPNGHFQDIIDEPVYGTSPYRIAFPFAEQADTLRYIRPNDYEVEVTLTDNCDRDSSFTLNMTVLYPSWLIVQKWDDVLALRNANYNGGYTFSQIAWYNEGTRLTGQGVNNSYLYTDSKNGETLRFGTAYWAELTRADDGKTICTCNKVPTKSKPEVQPKRIQIHLRNSGHQIDLTTDLNGSYTLYDITGKMLQTGKFGGLYNANTILIDKSCATGSYLLLFQSDEGDTQMEKIGVY